MILFVTFYIIFSYFIIINGDVKVNIKYGTIEGFEYKCVKGKNYNVFLGIPYAKPPIGELRFEES